MGGREGAGGSPRRLQCEGQKLQVDAVMVAGNSGKASGGGLLANGEGLAGVGGGGNQAVSREKLGARRLGEGRWSRITLAGAVVPVQGGIGAGR
jgi:hypothetical protein